MHPIGKYRIKNIGKLLTRYEMLEYPNIEHPVIGLAEEIESSNLIEKIPPHNTTRYWQHRDSCIEPFLDIYDRSSE
jgi:hypothetical protein